MQIRISKPIGGISADELAHIFDKFYHSPNSEPWKQGSTRLELALVKKQTEHLGDKITVESTTRQLCFTVELPLIEQMA